jgi:hypothetical protein
MVIHIVNQSVASSVAPDVVDIHAFLILMKLVNRNVAFYALRVQDIHAAHTRANIVNRNVIAVAEVDVRLRDVKDINVVGVIHPVNRHVTVPLNAQTMMAMGTEILELPAVQMELQLTVMMPT